MKIKLAILIYRWTLIANVAKIEVASRCVRSINTFAFNLRSLFMQANQSYNQPRNCLYNLSYKLANEYLRWVWNWLPQITFEKLYDTRNTIFPNISQFVQKSERKNVEFGQQHTQCNRRFSLGGRRANVEKTVSFINPIRVYSRSMYQSLQTSIESYLKSDSLFAEDLR